MDGQVVIAFSVASLWMMGSEKQKEEALFFFGIGIACRLASHSRFSTELSFAFPSLLINFPVQSKREYFRGRWTVAVCETLDKLASTV